MSVCRWPRTQCYVETRLDQTHIVMASSGSSVPSDLSKLTVPQLKALCKERRITGYSKLAKAALLQKLAEVAAAPKPTSPSSDHASRSATAAPSITPADEARNPAYTEPSTAHRDGSTTRQPVQPLTAGNTEPTDTSIAKGPFPTESSQNRTVASTTSTQKTSGTKRPAHIDISAPQKRIRTFLKSATNAGHGPPVPRTSTLQPALPVDSSVFKIPELPVQPKSLFLGSASTLAKQPSGTSKRSVVPRQSTGGPGLFKPLVVSKPKPAQGNSEPSRTKEVGFALAFDIHATPLPVLSHISFPPKASERKWVYRWAIILSALFPADRQTCRLVSRTFRYAGKGHSSEPMLVPHLALFMTVYLSATHILSKNYPGRRLDTILEQHPRNMANLWPYLRFRSIETSERRHAFKQSFLGQYTNSIEYDPLSEHLWTSPDDEKQVDVALRFVTR